MRTVRSHGVSVIEVPHFAGVEGDGFLFAAINANRQSPVRVDLLERAKVAVGGLERTIRRGELDAVAYGKLTLDLPVCIDAA